MLAAGIVEPRPIAKACGVRGDTVLRWLLMEEAEMPAKTAFKLATLLKVRFRWLVAGEGSPLFGEDEAAAFAILSSMSPAMTIRWLALGRRMAGIEE